MREARVLDDDEPAVVASGTVTALLRARIARGLLETWLTSSSGRSLAWVTNTERAMVMLLEGEGDPGEHAVDPEAVGSSGGFVRPDGQHDTYRDEDTVPIGEAFRLVEHIVRTGSWPAHASRVADR
ncbi:hypothetical protein PV392_26300 [Streptomyces sp. ME03-5709C]|nr:hypothetical protein [Streptomyces sp. ME03-5709C]